jgi:hypothetical protein
MFWMSYLKLSRQKIVNDLKACLVRYHSNLCIMNFQVYPEIKQDLRALNRLMLRKTKAPEPLARNNTAGQKLAAMTLVPAAVGKNIKNAADVNKF